MLTLPEKKRLIAIRPIALKLVLVALLLTTGACTNRNRAVDKLAKDTSTVDDFDGSLTFNDVTLEQANEKGQLWWKVKAKQASYSKDKKLARIQTPKGELYQDGKPIFQIVAQTGEVQQDGKKIFLKGQIAATDLRDGVLLRGNELEWRPEEDILIVRDNLTGTRKDVKVSAREARAYSRKRQIDLLGQVVAVSKDPAFQMKTEHLIWQLMQQKLISDRPVQLDRYANGASDRALADRAEVNLKTKTALLQQNARLLLVEPPLQVAGNSMLWNLNTQTVVADQPVSVLHRQQQVTLTANQGRMDLKQKIVYLSGNVQGVGQRNQSQINSNQLNWYIPTQEFQAEGNVVYRQANPTFNLTGPRAFGKLKDQSVVVSGGRVVTEIVPEPTWR